MLTCLQNTRRGAALQSDDQLTNGARTNRDPASFVAEAESKLNIAGELNGSSGAANLRSRQREGAYRWH